MTLKTRLQKLEASDLESRAGLEGHCAHLPVIVRYFDESGEEVNNTGPNAPTREEIAQTCNCGRERWEIHIVAAKMPQPEAL